MERLGALDVAKPYKFIGLGALDVAKPYKFIGFGAMAVTKPYKFIGFGALAVAPAPSWGPRSAGWCTGEAPRSSKKLLRNLREASAPAPGVQVGF